MIKTKRTIQLMSAGKIMVREFYRKRWLFGCLLFFVAGCNSATSSYSGLVITSADSIAEARLNERANAQIESIKKMIRSGDLVTRTGNDFTSKSLRQLNRRDKTYSHCGIASIENDSVFVYHALGGEFNPDQKICRDAIEIFGEPGSNRGMGIFRYTITADQRNNVMTTIKNWYTSGIMFDMKFDLATDDRMYCAEFVYKAFLSGTDHQLQFNISHISNFYFVGVDDLFMQPACNEITKIKYK